MGWEEKQFESSRCGPQPVGRKKPNGWGLYDLLGNVFEWTGDWYGTEVPSLEDPRGAAEGSLRVIRGGSWDSGARGVRAASRGSGAPSYSWRNLGFRLARGQNLRSSR